MKELRNVMDILGVILVVAQYGEMVCVKVVIIKERKIWTVQGNLVTDRFMI